MGEKKKVGQYDPTDWKAYVVVLINPATHTISMSYPVNVS